MYEFELPYLVLFGTAFTTFFMLFIAALTIYYVAKFVISIFTGG